MPISSINIPEYPYAPPEIRIYTKDSFGAIAGPIANINNKSSGAWTLLPAATVTAAGYELLMVNRTALPEIGTASFRYVQGTFAGQAAAWVAPSLLKKEVKIQARPASGGAWKTIFWGHVDFHEDDVYAAGSVTSGIRTYRCVDGFARATKWVSDYAGYFTGRTGDGGAPITMGPAKLNPGYNYQLESDGPILGNKTPDITKTFNRDGVTVPCHIWQGALAQIGTDPATQIANKWNEQEMVLHVCAATRPNGEPQFGLKGGAADNYNLITPQPVYDNETVFDVVSRICGRQKGNGVVWCDWTDAGDDLIVFLSVGSVFQSTNVYPIPGQPGVFGSITGATSGGTDYLFEGEYAWIIQGDHRNIDASFRITDGETNVHDFVEVFGERIESVATLCMYDGALDKTDPTLSDSIYSSYAYSLSPRWSAQDVTDFTALETQKRNMPYWNFVFQGFGLPRDWAGHAGNGFDSEKKRVDYRCDGAGEVVTPGNSDPADTPANCVELMGSLPLFEGYKYEAVSYPQRTDNTQQLGLPQRRAPTVYLRPAGWSDAELDLPNNQDRWFLPAGQLPSVINDEKIYPQGLQEFQPTMTVHPDGILVMSQAAMDLGLRYIADPVQDAARAEAKQVGAYIPVTRLAFTVSLRLPHRVRMYHAVAPATTWETARRRKAFYIQNVHLWLCAPNAIYDLKQTDPTKFGYEPLRGALGSTTTPAILRDDRPLLARYFQMAKSWYTTPRRRLTVGMKFCGFLPFDYLNPTVTSGTYPQMGAFISSFKAAGQVYEPKTVITAMHYDHQLGTTKWESDWFDLEFR